MVCCIQRAFLSSPAFLFSVTKRFVLQASRQAGRRVGFSLEEEDGSKFQKSVSLLGVLMD
jgi:hypothetical protein